MLGSPLFAGPTIEAAARVLLAVLDAAPSHALEVLVRLGRKLWRSLTTPGVTAAAAGALVGSGTVAGGHPSDDVKEGTQHGR